MNGIVFDFKAIRERRNHLGGKDIIKEYVQPEPRADWRDDPNVMRLGTVKAGEVLTDTKLSEMMDAWRKMREPLIGRSGATMEFVNPLAAALRNAAHRAANPPVFVENVVHGMFVENGVHGINWLELGTYGCSPAMAALGRIRNPSQDDDDPCYECGCDPCECDDEPAYEPE